MKNHDTTMAEPAEQSASDRHEGVVAFVEQYIEDHREIYDELADE